MINDYTFQIVSLGCAFLGFSSGVLGSFTFLRGESLFGDVLAHSALPGVCIAFLITGLKDIHILLLGAIFMGILCIFIIDLIKKYTKIKFDSQLAIILSTFFGFGLVLLSYIGKLPGANKAGLDKFIFGQASTILQNDIYFLIFLSILVIFSIFLFWKEFKIISFDREYAKSIGISPERFDRIISILTVVCVIIGIQTIGVVLISSLLTAPAVAARQLTDKLSIMVIISGVIGALGSVLGVIVSSSVDKIPAGPMISIIISFIAFISILFSPLRGIYKKKNLFLELKSDRTSNDK